jgi:uncharacterized protein (TIGR03067 family)
VNTFLLLAEARTTVNRRLLVGLLLTIVVTSCKPFAAPTLVGNWTPVSAELGGQDFPVANFAGATLHLTDSTYEFAGDTGTYAVLSVKEPAKMDIHGQSGPNAGRTIPAIFEVSAEQLTIGYQLGAGERPTEFASAKGEQILIVNYTRVH